VVTLTDMDNDNDMSPISPAHAILPSSSRPPFRVDHDTLQTLLNQPRSWWPTTVVEYALQLICDARPGWALLSAGHWSPSAGFQELELPRFRRMLLSRAEAHTILWPINIVNNHFLLAALRPRQGTCLCFDSLDAFPPAIITFIRSATPLSPSGIFLRSHPRQQDSHSCGPHVVWAAQALDSPTVSGSPDITAYGSAVLHAILRDTGLSPLPSVPFAPPSEPPATSAAPIPTPILVVPDPPPTAPVRATRGA